MELRPDHLGHAAVDRLCVIGGCPRGRETTVVLRIGGVDRELAVCELHRQAHTPTG